MTGETGMGIAINGVKSIDAFINGLQHLKNNQKYNDADPDWEQDIKDIYKSVMRRREWCGCK